MEEVARSLRNAELGRQDALKAIFDKVYLAALKQTFAETKEAADEIKGEMNEIDAQHVKQKAESKIEYAEIQKQMGKLEEELAIDFASEITPENLTKKKCGELKEKIFEFEKKLDDVRKMGDDFERKQSQIEQINKKKFLDLYVKLIEFERKWNAIFKEIERN